MASSRSDRSSALLALFERHGFSRLETPVLQPASTFLELSGEEIRRRLYLTQDAAGTEYCLRPEHTIPVCRHHLTSGREAGDYAYLGPVFRQRAGESGEFLQAGIESIGQPDAAEADSRILSLALDALSAWGEGRFSVRTGDMDLIEAVLGALEVPAALQRRIVRQLSSGGSIDRALAPSRPLSEEYSGLLAAIEGQHPKAARAFVEDVISIAGISQVGGRSAAEIAERFLSRANRERRITDRARAVLGRWATLEASLAEAGPALERVAAEERLEIADALTRFRRRVDLLASRGIAVGELAFSARFARNFDYYTGFIFEAHDRTGDQSRFVVAGGRYDRLLQHLGSAKPLPAVGCSFWLDRLEALR